MTETQTEGLCPKNQAAVHKFIHRVTKRKVLGVGSSPPLTRSLFSVRCLTRRRHEWKFYFNGVTRIKIWSVFISHTAVSPPRRPKTRTGVKGLVHSKFKISLLPLLSRCRWRLWWRFPIQVTLLEFHREMIPPSGRFR